MMRLLLLLALLAVCPLTAEAASRGNPLSKREQLRYQDVLKTRDGSIWRGRLVERGEVFRIRLEDGNEVAIPQAQVASVTREPHPAHPHQGQWTATASAGIEVAYMLGGELGEGGMRYGPSLHLGLGHNFGGAFEPEVSVIVCPVAEEVGQYSFQVAVGSRYYLQPSRRAKPFTTAQFVLNGTKGDLALRTGPGILVDLSPNVAFGLVQGITLLVQTDTGQVGPGYHALGMLQGRF